MASVTWLYKAPFSQLQKTHPDGECCICQDPFQPDQNTLFHIAEKADTGLFSRIYKVGKDLLFGPDLNIEIKQKDIIHAYHDDCLIPWLKKQNTCPTCKLEVEEAPATKNSLAERVSKLFKQEFTIGSGLLIRPMHTSTSALICKITGSLILGSVVALPGIIALEKPLSFLGSTVGATTSLGVNILTGAFISMFGVFNHELVVLGIGQRRFENIIHIAGAVAGATATGSWLSNGGGQATATSAALVMSLYGVTRLLPDKANLVTKIDILKSLTFMATCGAGTHYLVNSVAGSICAVAGTTFGIIGLLGALDPLLYKDPLPPDFVIIH